MTGGARTRASRRCLAIACLLLHAAAAAQPFPEPLHLQDALELAGTSHPLLTAGRAELEQLEAAAARIEARDDIDIGARLAARLIEPSDAALDQSSNDSRAELFARKRLYDFGRTSALEAAAATQLTGGRLRYSADLAQYRIAVMRAFFDVLLADLEYARDNESMAVAYVEADRLRDRNELGQVADVQLLKQEDAYQALRIQRLRSQSRQRSTRARLAQLLNRPDDLPVNLAPPTLAENDRPLPEYEQLVESALAANPRVLSLRAELEAARQNIRAERAGRRPVLSGSVIGTSAEREVSSRNPLEAELRLDIPLFRGNRVNAEVAGAQAEMHRLAAAVQQFEYDLRQDLLEIWLDMQALRAQREQVSVNAEFRSLDFDRAQALYELEVTTDFGNALVGQSKAALLDARTEFALALGWARLSALTGENYSPFLQMPASSVQPGNHSDENSDR